MPTKIEKDEATGRETTGHEWDGIKELDTPLPKWWLYTFYACILYALVYVILYPAWPGLSGHTAGVLGYTRRGELAAELAAEKARRGPMEARIAAADIEQIRHDPDMLAYAQAAGRLAFAENCQPCHGAGGAGAKGYPNLADDDWLWGGTPQQILQSIRFGVRNENADSHLSDMPRFGADKLLTTQQIADVASYVLSLSGGGGGMSVTRGKTIFADNCAACHGEAATGNADLGAPNLADKIWLYGGDRASVIESIASSRRGSMPAWAERLDPVTVKVLAAYVHAFGGGRQTTAEAQIGR